MQMSSKPPAIAESPPPADAIELEIFKHLFAAIAEEMGARLMRSAYSPNIKERRDFSCAVFNHTGDLIAQAAHIPVHLGSMPMSVAAALAAIKPDEMKAGDRIVLNDPFAGGTHLPDITVIAPCILPGESTPRFFVANRAHHADVGGVTAGSMPLATCIEDEGLRIAPMLLTPDTVDWICTASRTPGERRGDLMAQLAALESGAARLTQLCETYGADRVELRAVELMDYSARLARAVLARIPNGDYSFSDVLDDDGFGAMGITIDCHLKINDGRITADFSRSGDQVTGPVNAVRAITVSAVSYVVRCLCPADTPSNAGVMRAVDVVTRPGSVVDAQPPGGGGAGNVETSQRIVDVVLGAMAQALPGLIPAASQGTMNNIALGGIDHRHGAPFAYYETVGGGCGAGPSADGASALHSHMTNTLNTPVEALEHEYPLRVEEYSIRAGSGGEGQHCGGDGLVRRISAGAELEATLLTERRRHPPYGLQGGKPGTPGSNVLIHADGTREQLPGKVKLTLVAGEQLEISAPGGGGWGQH
jgi:N-methylhydantoinase B